MINPASTGGGWRAGSSQTQNKHEDAFAPETARPEEETRHRGRGGGVCARARGAGATRRKAAESRTGVRPPEMLADYESAGESPGVRSEKKLWERSRKTKGNKCHKN